VTVASRGDVWIVDLDPVRGHEQGGRRPGLVVSVDSFNRGRAGLAVVLPFTSVEKRLPLHVEVAPPEGGLRQRSFVKPEDVRSVSTERLTQQLGTVSPETMKAVETSLRLLLDL
jgi:mRNA interferase MazF